jgi:class 3 adenylate cyclase
MHEPPLGNATLLFTDIAGSTRLWERDPERMRDALARRHAIRSAAIEVTRVMSAGQGARQSVED